MVVKKCYICGNIVECLKFTIDQVDFEEGSEFVCMECFTKMVFDDVELMNKRKVSKLWKSG